jgi:hypothetical protein
VSRCIDGRLSSQPVPANAAMHSAVQVEQLSCKALKLVRYKLHECCAGCQLIDTGAC